MIKDDVVHAYSGISLTHKKSEIMLFVTRMDLEIIILNEACQTKTNMMWYHLYVESKKMIQTNLFRKQKQTHRLRKQTYSYQREKGEGKYKLGGGY